MKQQQPQELEIGGVFAKPSLKKKARLKQRRFHCGSLLDLNYVIFVAVAETYIRRCSRANLQAGQERLEAFPDR